MSSRFRRFATLAAIAVPLAAASAQDGEQVARFESWTVQVFDRESGKICLVASQPIESEPPVGDGEGEVRRGQIAFVLSDRPTEGVRNEVWVQMGYPLASDVTVRVDDGEVFDLVTNPDDDAPEEAWLPTAVEDRLLTSAMRAGLEMVVRGTSQRGTETIDTYSLLGVTAALNRSAEECQ